MDNTLRQAMTTAPSTVPELNRGQAGWFLLGTLGISCVIAGEFAGWNWGLARGGWGGMMLATLVTAVMYYALVFCVAELACIIPTAGGGYGFARCAFGPCAGFMTGMAVTLQYTVAVAVIAIFIGAYFASLTGLSGWPVPTLCFVIACGLHCLGVGDAMRLMVVLAVAALVGILLFLAIGAFHVSVSRLYDIPPIPGSITGSARVFPFGGAGVWACLPYALAGFVGVESIALASEEAREPIKDIPVGLLMALGTLLVLMVAVLCVAPGVQGSAELSASASPLVDALLSIHGNAIARNASRMVNVAGVVGLAASFFSAIYAYSRQVFALSRAGYLPTRLALVNHNLSPWLAVLVPGVFAYTLCLLGGSGDQLYVLLIFFSLAAYVSMFSSHIKMRSSSGHLSRPYRTPGGAATAWMGLTLTLIMLVACFLASPFWSSIGFTILGLLWIYYLVYARHRLLSRAPEEEFALARAAEAGLDGR